MCGGETEDRQLLDRFESISLADGTTSTKSLTFITGAAKFDLHLLNIPQAFLKEGENIYLSYAFTIVCVSI